MLRMVMAMLIEDFFFILQSLSNSIVLSGAIQAHQAPVSLSAKLASALESD